MAKEAPKKAEAAEEAPPPPKKSMKKLIVIVVAAVLVLALIGGGAVYMLKKKASTAEGEEAVVAEQETPAFDPHKPPIFVPLEPFTVNLQPENGEQFLQVVASLRVANAEVGEQVKGYMPQIRHEMLGLLGAKMASEITAPDGREALAEEMKDTINRILGYEPPKKKKTTAKKKAAEPETNGPIIAIFFTQFIVQ